MDVTSNLHPFFTHRLDAGPIRLVTIAHSFNYRVAVLRDGVNSADQVGRSRKAEGRFLDDTDISSFHGDSRWLSCLEGGGGGVGWRVGLPAPVRGMADVS